MSIKRVLLLVAAVFAVTSCFVQEEAEQQSVAFPGGPVFEGIIEEDADIATKAYADENLKVLWHKDDRVSIFNRLTYNREFRFTGETGDNSGSFSLVPTSDFITGNELSYVYAVYPYKTSNSINNSGTMSLDLPAEQTYSRGSFGRGDNTMIAVTEDNVLIFRNLSGYLMFKLYGAGLKVTSLSLEANGGEALAGKATVNMAPGGVPEASIASEGSSSKLTLICDTPVSLGTSEDDYTEFWFVVPPVTMSQGFKLTVNLSDGSVFEKSISNKISITRNRRSRMSPLKVEPAGVPLPPADELWYTTTDGKVVAPNTPGNLNAAIVSNTYENGKGVIKFDGPLTTIGVDAFYYRPTLQTVVMSDAVTAIGDYGFENCYNLESIRLSANLKSIGRYTLSYCSSLGSISIPESVQSLGESAFSGCEKLTSVYIPESVTSVGSAVFGYCRSLTGFYGKYASEDHRILVVNNELNSFAPYGLNEYTIQEGITSIGTYAFEDCSSLTSIVLPQSLESIKSYAFAYCSSLRAVKIPSSVTSIYAGAFRNCSSLQEFSGKFATSDGRALVVDKTLAAFAPYGLTDYSVPDGVVSIGNTVFSSCRNLQAVTLPASLEEIGSSAFYYCTSLSDINMPDRLTRINSSAFYYCSSLTGINLPEGLTRIESSAFRYCKAITKMVVPSSVTYMGSYVFGNDTALESVTLLPKTPPQAGTNMFVNCNTIPVYVPASAVKAYKNADNWNTYADWFQSIPGDVFFEVSPEAVTLSSEAQPFFVTVNTDQQYHADVPSNVTWITAGAVSGSQDEGFKHVFNVSKNEGEERQAVIAFCTSDGVCHSVMVTQKKEDPSIAGFDWNKDFYRRSLFMRFTATWCGYCPNMAKSVKMAQAAMPDKIEAVNIHCGGSNLQFDSYFGLDNQYQITGYPSGIVDGRRLVQNYSNEYAVSLIKQYIEETEQNYPVSSTIGFDSYFNGNTLGIDLQLYLRNAADYKVTVLLLESGIVGYQADNYDGSHQDYVHDDIARIAVTNVLGDSFSTASDCAIKQLSYSVNVPSSYVKDNLKILVYVQRAFGSQTVLSTADYGGYYVDNCVSGKAGTKLAPAVVSNGSGDNEGFGQGNPINW